MTHPEYPTPHEQAEAPPQDDPKNTLQRLMLIVFSVLVLFISVGSTFWMLNTVPRSRRRKPRQYATLVELLPIQLTRKQIQLKAMGTVQPTRLVTLYPRVRGEIVNISKALLPGGLFRRGRRLLSIDPADYRLAVQQRKSMLEQALSTLAIEKGRQQIARREFAMLGKGDAKINRQLMLRTPQLESAKANVRAAKAALAQARLNLKRTTIRAPFDAIVVKRMINKGSRVTETTQLLQLAGTHHYWVELAIAVDQLKWIEIPLKGRTGGSPVRIYHPDAWGPNDFRSGTVLRLYPSVEDLGRMARLLVQIKDPLGIEAKGKRPPRLLLGSYVKAHIMGRFAPPAVVLPRRYLRDNQTVWLMGPDNKLLIRSVQVLFRGEQEVIIGSGLREGERLITTLLPTPVAGMPLRTRSQQTNKKRRRSKKRRKRARRQTKR